MISLIENTNILSSKPLISPEEIKKELMPSEAVVRGIASTRKSLKDILDRKDPRAFVILGPCSIHDPVMAMEYAQRLKKLADEVKDSLYLVMRVYFEKPRTTVGWKGFITDPHLDDSFDIDHGLYQARKLLLEIAELGLPTATEFVDPIIPQYFAELLSWTAIGARTTESQKHREMASGLSTPVGFKNNTDGGMEAALNAIISAGQSHQFLGINNKGDSTIFETRGNSHVHIVLRGGREPNYDTNAIAECERALAQANLPKNIVVDCSHGNSFKDYRRQPEVFANCIQQVAEGNQSIVGLMLESHLHEGNQKISKDLKYGVSLTDGCINWETTAQIIHSASEKLNGLSLRSSK